MWPQWSEPLPRRWFCRSEDPSWADRGAGTERGRAGVASRPGQREAEWLCTPGGQAAGMGGQ